MMIISKKYRNPLIALRAWHMVHVQVNNLFQCQKIKYLDIKFLGFMIPAIHGRPKNTHKASFALSSLSLSLSSRSEAIEKCPLYDGVQISQVFLI